MTSDECLAAAWTYLAPNRLVIPELPHGGFPTGFWPDVATVAMEMFAQQTKTPKLNREFSRCARGDYPERRATVKGIDLGKLEINL
jgi:hypothetical protein